MEEKNFSKNDKNFINEKIFQNDENNYVINSSYNDELILLNNNDNSHYLNSNASSTNSSQCNHFNNKIFTNDSPSLEGIKTVKNTTENFKNSSLYNSKNNSFPDHKSCLEHESNSPEYYHTIINSIINDKDYDMPDSSNNNNTSQSDIKMTEITSNPLRKRPCSSSIPDFSNTYPNSRFKDNHYNTDKMIASVFMDTPNNYTEAINCPNKSNWINAIKDELNNLYNNKIMTFVKRIPKNKNLITTKWVFATKKDANNNIIKYKARLVARGFKQKYGIDYELTYSPALNIDGLKLIFALSAKFRWNVYQLDIKAAYLNAPLDRDIYTTIPKGDSNFGRGYWKLNKALYGLKQSGRQWNKTITKFLIKQGFKQILSEKCIFKYSIKNKTKCIIGLYVDDMIIAGEDKIITDIIKKIKNKFKVSNCGPVEYILGIKVEKENNKYIISQKGFIENLLNKFNIKNTRKRNTPCTGDNIKSENKNPFNITTYKSAIGSLIYLSKCTRPDIAFAVNKAARKCECPTVKM